MSEVIPDYLDEIPEDDDAEPPDADIAHVVPPEVVDELLDDA